MYKEFKEGISVDLFMKTKERYDLKLLQEFVLGDLECKQYSYYDNNLQEYRYFISCEEKIIFETNKVDSIRDLKKFLINIKSSGLVLSKAL